MGSYPANGFGLYDVHGNVWEWCKDWFDPKYYANGPLRDPLNLKEGLGRVNRGGSWNSNAGGCQTACRNNNAPSARYNSLGFRVALVPTR